MKKNLSPWWIFFSVFLASSMLFFDQAILPVALPSIQKALSASSVQIAWILNAYRLTIASLVLAGGRLADMFGLRRIFCIGMGIFTIASLLCGFSQIPEMLIFFRMIQGIGAALVIPTLSPLLFPAFPVTKRGFVVGIKVGLSSILMTLGPYIGGVFTEYLSWRYIFWINPVIGIIGIIFVLFFVPVSKRAKTTFDFLGFFVFTTMLTSFSLTLMQGKNWGWISIPILILSCLFIVFFSFLLFLERTKKHAFINFSFFRENIFRVCAINVLVVKLILTISFFWPIFLQQVLQYSPSKTGIFSAMNFIPMLIAGPIAGKLVDKWGARKPLLLGHLGIILSFVGILFFLPLGGWGLIVSFLVMGFGGTLALTPSFVGGLNSVGQLRRGRAAGLMNAARSLGISLSITLIGAIIFNVQNAMFITFLKSNPHTINTDPNAFDGILSHLKKAELALQKFDTATQQNIIFTLKKSLTIANQVAIIVGILLSLAMFMYIYFCMHKTKKIADSYDSLP